MAEEHYPIHVYKSLNAPRYANDKKQLDEMELKGWTRVRANIGLQEYPRHLYREDGDVVLVGDYDEDGVIDLEAAKAEETRLTESGYGRTPVAANAKPEAPVKGIMESIVDVKANADRLTALESDVASIKSGMADILAALTAAKPPAAKPPAAKPKKNDKSEEPAA